MEEEIPPKRPKLNDDVGEIYEEGGDPENGSEAESEGGHDHAEDAILEEELREAQTQLDEKHEEMLDKMRQVEAEYNIVKKPLYAARANVIRRIPGFWLHCFLQHADLRLILGGVDQDILAYLEEVRVEAFANSKTGYRIVFVFVSNPYFEDQVLSKEVHFTEMEDHPAVICRVTGCQPTWKDESAALLEAAGKAGPPPMAFLRWFLEENELEEGMVDPLADIIKDQLFVNPLEFLDVDVDEAQVGATNGDRHGLALGEDLQGDEDGSYEQGEQEFEFPGEELEPYDLDGEEGVAASELENSDDGDDEGEEIVGEDDGPNWDELPEHEGEEIVGEDDEPSGNELPEHDDHQAHAEEDQADEYQGDEPAGVRELDAVVTHEEGDAGGEYSEANDAEE